MAGEGPLRESERLARPSPRPSPRKSGLALAMVLYLISVGLSVTMGLMGFVNLAHGAFAMAGGYAMTTLMNRYGAPFWLALVAAVVIVGFASLVLERVLYRRFYGGGELNQVLLTMGLIFMSVGAATYFWGPVAQPIQLPQALRGQIDLGVRDFPVYRSFLILCGALLVTALWLALERTRFGVRVRAAVDNLAMAQTLWRRSAAGSAPSCWRSRPAMRSTTWSISSSWSRSAAWAASAGHSWPR